jgi:hypothetical protein
MCRNLREFLLAMEVSVAFPTKGDEVLVRVMAELASRRYVVNF